MSILMTVLLPAPAKCSSLVLGMPRYGLGQICAVTRLADKRYQVWEALRMLLRLALMHDVDESVGAVQEWSACPFHDAEPRRANVRYVQRLLLLGCSVMAKDPRQPADDLDVNLFVGPPINAHGSSSMRPLLAPTDVAEGIVGALHTVPRLDLEATLATRLLARNDVGAHPEKGG